MRFLPLAALALVFADAAGAAPSKKPPEWLSTEFPLPLGVRTPQDLAFKEQAEREFLIFNLLVSGKVAWDAGDFATAAQKWEVLISIKGLEPEVDKVVRPLLIEARAKAGSTTALPPPPAEGLAVAAPKKERPRKAALASVEGIVSGGGPAGPGGAVITLKRTDGEMPKLVPQKDRVVLQKGKAFLPRVVAIPAGSTVIFRNEDPINHNVFSLSKPGAFDTGSIPTGNDRTEQFEKAGVVLLCNVHASMLGWVVVVDTPLYGQADAAGAFKIVGVPPGEYDVETWHEFASKPTKQKLTVGKDGATVQIAVGGDRVPPNFTPDKYGKPRQEQLGY